MEEWPLEEELVEEEEKWLEAGAEEEERLEAGAEEEGRLEAGAEEERRLEAGAEEGRTEAGAEEEELPLLELMRSSIIVHRFIAYSKSI